MNLNVYSPQTIIGACVVVLLVMVAIAWGVKRRRNLHRTEELRRRFGPEYDAAVVQYGSRRKAEAALVARLRRAEHIQVRPLTTTERSRFMAEWDSIQGRFVDHPRGAVTEADELINSVLQARGFPGGVFEQRASDVSVQYPRLVDPYRRANSITVHAAQNESTTEELRSAMILYRALFEELVQSKTVAMPRAA
ncbi:MAG TPA: hypothetical protein VG225_08860 [Terracidiphilus sp.]|jgi:hypothetical protein|nr:hypothetical protein [Terracidiphilus sp.]